MKHCLSAISLALAVGCAAVAAPADDPPPAHPTLIGRSAHFDFEDAARLPIEMPPEFMNLGPRNSLAPFGEIRLSDAAAVAGRWSLEFTLDGESLIAGTRPGVLPIFPLTDYEISVRVRTRDVDRARARLVGRLFDAHGAPIDGTMAESAPITSENEWSTLTVLVPGASEDATHLGIELQVLQPQHWRGLDPERVIPVLADVDGVAWFDELVVRHRPAITLSTAPLHDPRVMHEFITADRAAFLHTEVRDLTSVALDAEISLTDFCGRDVPFEHRNAVAIGRESRLPLDALPAGWYEALLDVRSPNGRIGAERLTFAVLPPHRRGVPFGMQRLGVVTPWLPTNRIGALPRINAALAAQCMTIELWDADAPSAVSDERIATLRRVIHDLLGAECAITFALAAIPDELASAVGLDPPQILELLARPAELWRPHLDPFLVNYGLLIRRWQIGGAQLPAETYEQYLAAIRQALATLIPEPALIASAWADHPIPAVGADMVPRIILPAEVDPTTLDDWLDQWPDADQRILHLETRSGTPRDVMLDLALRTLYAWRAGIDELTIDAPWTWTHRGAAMPSPAFSIWRGLSDTLAGRRFVESLDLGPGVHAWLFEGASSDDHAVIAWRDGQPDDPPTDVDLVLSEHSVRVADLFGNTSMLHMVNGRHTLALTDFPVVVEGVDLALARFRASFRIESNEIPAEHRVHDRELILMNPWPLPISGTLEIDDIPGLRLEPNTISFTIPPGETLRKPVSFVFQGGIIGGPRVVRAVASVQASQAYRINLQTDLDVGWKNVELDVGWRVQRNERTGEQDLIVFLTVTNRGPAPLSLDAFVSALSPDVQIRRGQRRMMIQPGATERMSHQIPNGAVRLSGEVVRYGVSQRDGAGRLNELLRLPELTLRAAAVDE